MSVLSVKQDVAAIGGFNKIPCANFGPTLLWFRETQQPSLTTN